MSQVPSVRLYALGQAGLPKEERAPVRAVQKAASEGLFIVLSLCTRAQREERNTCIRRKLRPVRGVGPKAPGALGAPKPRWWGNDLVVDHGRKVSCQRSSRHSWEAVEPSCLAALRDQPVYQSAD